MTSFVFSLFHACCLCISCADGEDILGPVAEDALLDPTMKRITGYTKVK